MKTFAFIHTDPITFDEEIVVMTFKPVLARCTILNKSYYKSDMINVKNYFTTNEETDAKLLAQYNNGMTRSEARNVARDASDARCEELTKSLREKEEMEKAA